ncbi:MAG: DUF222 domain-containing protein, partial [Acidimicrobiia bacterium]|nr:DUF222 domain-containing protein [Acidimicrobiia bacterium]
SSEALQLVKTALDAATPPPATDDPRTAAQRRADALVDICRQALDNGGLPESGGEKPHLMVLVDLDMLTGQGSGTAETIDGDILARSTLQQISYDASITRIIFGPHSQPIDVGHNLANTQLLGRHHQTLKHHKSRAGP